MAKFRLFHSSYKDRNGKIQQTENFYVEFKDHRDRVRRLSAFTSKDACEELGRNLCKLVEYHKGTGGQTDPSLLTWLSCLPLKIKEKLAEWGIIEEKQAAAAKPLTEHLEDWKKSLVAAGNSLKHVIQNYQRAKKVFSGCKFRFYADISASRIQSFLHDLRQDKKDEKGNEVKGISAQTFNYYLFALKQFCRWMVKDRRATESPIDHLDGLNVRTDRRHDRRAFTLEELERLLEAARTGPARRRMTGEERRLLYWLAVETGLRANELRSLTRDSFDLDGDSPTVTVQASYSKRRREDTLPLRPDLAAALRSHLAMKAPDAPAFAMPTSKHIAEMFKQDLAAAGIAYVDDSGRYGDFHALRHTFITNLAKGGVHPKTAQDLARHSKIDLTMQKYTHTLREQLSGALNVLPDISKPAQEARATGTDGRPTSTDKLPLKSQKGSVSAEISAERGGLSGILLDSNRRTGENDPIPEVLFLQAEMAENAGKNAKDATLKKKREGGTAFRPLSAQRPGGC